MKWFKHDTDANQDAKLQNVLLDYGLEGYGLYWYCVELIAGKVTKDNLTFELEHDARIIARNVGSTSQKVEEMMRYFVDQGLFSDFGGIITCIKLLNRIDSSMSGNPAFRKAIDEAKKTFAESTLSHDSVMNIEDRRYNRSKDLFVSEDPETKRTSSKKFKYSDRDMAFARNMAVKISQVNAAFIEPNSLEAWADTIRLTRERDGRSTEDLWSVFVWANNDNFWKDNIQSPAKLRKQYSQLHSRMSNEKSKAKSAGDKRSFVIDGDHTKSAGDRVRDSILRGNKEPG